MLTFGSDPLFQHTLVRVVRDNSALFGLSATLPTTQPDDWSGLPVVFDEVFTGLYRLGRFSAASFLKSLPDISVHAKLLTGGLVPLCATLASNSIYNCFLATEKSDALLHGHSYTAHPVGCHVANTSLRAMSTMDADGAWQRHKDDWRQDDPADATRSGSRATVWSVWSKAFVENISNGCKVESVVALGSVLAIKLQDVNAGKHINITLSHQIGQLIRRYLQVMGQLQRLVFKSNYFSDLPTSTFMLEYWAMCYISWRVKLPVR